jgi:energy-coupling factor transporter transmembrane protein EcfT
MIELSVRPELKILAYVLLVIGIFMNQSLPVAFVVSLIALGLALKFASKSFKRSARIVSIVLTFTFCSNLLFHPGKVLCAVCGLYITEQGLIHAALMTLRLFAMILGAQLLNSTTSSEELLKAMERLIGPIGRLKFVKEVGATFYLTLKYLPLMLEQARECYRNLPASKKKGFMGKVELRVSLFITLLERTLQTNPHCEEKKEHETRLSD